MLELPTITLACLDSVNHAAALAALRASMAQCRFGRVLWVTNDPGAGSDTDGIDVFRTTALVSEEAYSHFVIRDLLPHVTTSHVLVQQWDGYVAHGDAWRDEFLRYDYIGAPWPTTAPCPPEYRVGNGGFSLRSRRLFEILDDLDLPPFHPEDLGICLKYRPHLERAGITFAPIELANNFSYEGLQPIRCFGFHGMQSLSARLSLVELNQLLQMLPMQTRRGLKTCLAASAHYRSGKFEHARLLLSSMVENPECRELDDFITVMLGNVLVRLGRSGEAGTWWQNQLVASLDPDKQTSQEDRGKVLATRAMLGCNLGCVYLLHEHTDLAHETWRNALKGVAALGDKVDPVLRECLQHNLALGGKKAGRPRMFEYPLSFNWLAE